MSELWMDMQYAIERREDGSVEAAARLCWHTATGYYDVAAVGFGADEGEAKKSASLMLGQARSALHKALIEGVNRVPGTQEPEMQD